MATWSNISKNSATWTNATKANLAFYLLKEDSSYLLKEDSGKIVLETSSSVVWAIQTKN